MFLGRSVLLSGGVSDFFYYSPLKPEGRRPYDRVRRFVVGDVRYALAKLDHPLTGLKNI